MRTSEPFVRIPEDVIPKMLDMASLKAGEMVFDLGAGDGRIVVAAARLYDANAMGFDLRPRLVRESRAKIRELGLAGRVKIFRRNFKDVPLGRADVLALYLSSYTLSKLSRRFRKELRPGSRIVNFDFPIPDWDAAVEELIIPKGWKKPHSIYLYIV